MDFKYVCEESLVENYTEREVADIYLYSDAVAAIVVVIMPCILVFGVISNLSFLVVVLRVKHMRTVTNYILVQLAVADVVHLIFSVGERVWRYASSPVIFDKSSEGLIPGCVVIPFFKSTSYFASLSFMIFVTLEMYMAICKPIRHRVISGPVMTMKLTLASWGLAVLVACLLLPSSWVLTPVCIVWPSSRAYEDIPTVAASCEAIAPWVDRAHNIIQSFPFYISVVVNTVLYVRTMKALRMRVAVREQPFQVPVRARNQVAHMLVINSLVSFVLLSPFEFYSLVTAFDTDTTRTTILIAYTCRALSYLNSAVNPLIFYTVHPRYRRAFVQTCSRYLNIGQSV